jgi:hypothetical protein
MQKLRHNPLAVNKRWMALIWERPGRIEFSVLATALRHGKGFAWIPEPTSKAMKPIDLSDG